jgi:phenylpropionate dioxygenase-like ring-hydroxylating dioxygenase large terminal subunit
MEILPGAPWLIAHRSMLGINQPHKITLNGQDYVLWQTTQGEILALNNVCPHMQAPLSEGWICQNHGTITCPFHALSFDGSGRLYHANKQDREVQPIAKSLDLVISGDLIWTYAGHPPRLPIPNLIDRLTEGYEFMGVARDRSLQSNFLSALKINYDFNHSSGTHREPYRINDIRIRDYQLNGYAAKLTQEVRHESYAIADLAQNPLLLTSPDVLVNEFEYTFPSTTGFISQFHNGKTAAFFVLYPESETQTRTFALIYGKGDKPLGKFLLRLARSSILKAFALVVEQDAKVLASLYLGGKPQIRLPREEVMFDAENLYFNWPQEKHPYTPAESYDAEMSLN